MVQNRERRPEILAPAGSYDSFLAAIHAGADAVYLGGTMFSARALADNFTQQQLLQALDYAHLHNRKIYMTVNTLLKEEEIKRLPEYLLPYYQQGLDAVIVQDAGVLKVVADCFPDMAIHLSTQMTLTGSMGANLLKNFYPITRLVPARELSLEELKKLRKETELELEVFIHGALCVCYSGQCFFSSLMGGRSGNRGKCTQPCRKQYNNILENKKSYLLSPKDLCTLELLPELIEAGIDSFKIEGRMKKPEYAAYISWIYRKYTDRFLQYGKKEYKEFIQKNSQEWEEDLQGMKDLYNRGGFTKGYFLCHNSTDMMSEKRPNHEGVFVGNVEDIKRNVAKILWKQEIFPQDVLEIRNDGRKVYEYTSGFAQKRGEKSNAKFYTGIKVKKGMEVYRTRNNQLLSWINENLIKPPCKKRLYGCFRALIGEAVSLEVWEEGNFKEKIKVMGAICQKANKQPTTKEEIKHKLFRLGEFPFLWENLEIKTSENVFLPLKSINELRRQALEEFQKKYREKFQRKIEKEEQWLKEHLSLKKEQKLSKIEKNSKRINLPKPPEIAAEILTLEQWKAALSLEQVSIIYVRLEILEEKELISFAEKTKKREKQCYLSMPRVLHESKRKIMKKIIVSLMTKGLCDGILLHNIEELGFIKELLKEKEIKSEQEIKLIADFSMYSTNSMAISFWQKQGCHRLTASIEQKFTELLELFSWKDTRNKIETEIQIYGKLPLMILAQCITSHAKKRNCISKEDRAIFANEQKEKLYAINFCRFCYNILYSEKPCDLRYQTELFAIPFSVWRCSFIDETKQETKEILESVEEIRNGNYFPKPPEVWTGNFHKGMI